MDTGPQEPPIVTEPVEDPFAPAEPIVVPEPERVEVPATFQPRSESEQRLQASADGLSYGDGWQFKLGRTPYDDWSYRIAIVWSVPDIRNPELNSVLYNNITFRRELPDDVRWQQAMEGLRKLSETWMLRWQPDTFAVNGFGDGLSAFDISSRISGTQA